MYILEKIAVIVNDRPIIFRKRIMLEDIDNKLILSYKFGRSEEFGQVLSMISFEGRLGEEMSSPGGCIR